MNTQNNEEHKFEIESDRLNQNIRDLLESRNEWKAEADRLHEEVTVLRHATGVANITIASLHELNQELLDALKMARQIIGHPEDILSKHIEEVIARAESTYKAIKGN